MRAAREVFSAHGYDGTTFRVIAARAGLTRPAVSHYYTGKMQLYREVLQQTHSLALGPAIERAHREGSLLQRLNTFIAVLVQANVADRSVGALGAASLLEAQRHPELRPDIDGMQQEARDFLTWAVTDAVEKGELTTQADVPSLVEMLLAAMWGLGFYAAGFIGNAQRFDEVAANFQLLIAQKLWQLDT